MHPEFDDFDDESTLMWDEEAKTVSLKIRLKTATALVAVGLLMASPASAQVVIGRGSTGSELQVVAPPRSQLPPEWLRHVPKAPGNNKPYQPTSRTKTPAPAQAAPQVAPNYTAPAPLPVTPSAVPIMRPPRLDQSRNGGIDVADTFQPAPPKEGRLMAAPWSPRAQRVERPLFPELQQRQQMQAPGRAPAGGAVLAAPQLGGAKPTTSRGQNTLPPVLTGDLMGSLRQAAQEEDAGMPPPMPRDEGNGVNASSAQDRSQSLGTIERSRVDALIAEREARESGRPYAPRAPAPREPETPLPPAPMPTPVPQAMGYLTPPRGTKEGRDDDITVPAKPPTSPYDNDSLKPLDADKSDEVTVRVEDDVPADTTGRRVLGRVSDKQKPTVYNEPVPVPMDNVATPVPPPADAVEQPVDDKTFKAEGRKLFSGAKKKKTADGAEQLSLFEQAKREGRAATPRAGSTITKVPQTGESATAPEGGVNVLRAPDARTTKPLESAGHDAADTATTVAADGTKEIKEVPVNRTPFGDNVISTITADGTKDEEGASAPVATTQDGVPDITTAQEAPKVLGKGPRKVTKRIVAAPATKKVEAPKEDIIEAPAKPAPEPKPEIKVETPAEDEIRVVVDDEPAAAAPVKTPEVISPRVEDAPRNVLRAPRAAPSAPKAPEPYVPPQAALRREYRDNAAQTLQAPTSLRTLDEAPVEQPEERMPAPRAAAPVERPAAPTYTGPRATQEQMYVQTPAAEPGRQRLRTPKLLLQSDLPMQAPAPVAEITPDAADTINVPAAAPVDMPEPVVEPTVIERPQLREPAEPEVTPVYIAPPPAEVELRMPTITFGPTDRDLDHQGETQAAMLAEQMSLNPGRKLTLIAYAQAPNLNESRRIALSRALAIRSRLAEAGIQPIRVSIRAVGTLPPGDRGTPDRVDTIIQ